MINEYPGGYDDWLSQRKPTKEVIRPKETIAARALTPKEQRELNNLPLVIEKIETEQKELCALLTDFNFYQKDPEEIASKARSEFLSDELEKAYTRWEYLEELSE